MGVLLIAFERMCLLESQAFTVANTGEQAQDMKVTCPGYEVEETISKTITGTDASANDSTSVCSLLQMHDSMHLAMAFLPVSVCLLCSCMHLADWAWLHHLLTVACLCGQPYHADSGVVHRVLCQVSGTS